MKVVLRSTSPLPTLLGGRQATSMTRSSYLLLAIAERLSANVQGRDGSCISLDDLSMEKLLKRRCLCATQNHSLSLQHRNSSYITYVNYQIISCHPASVGVGHPLVGLLAGKLIQAMHLGTSHIL